MRRDLFDRCPDHELARFAALGSGLRQSMLDHGCGRRVLRTQIPYRRKGDQLIDEPHANGAEEYEEENFCPIPHQLSGVSCQLSVISCRVASLSAVSGTNICKLSQNYE